MAALVLPAPAALVAERIAAVRAELDGDSLHDFRVALRRLRSMLRVHDTLADEPLPEDVTGGLGAIARATNLGRDLEVKLEWLAERRKRARKRERAGIDWLRERLERRRVGGWADGQVGGLLDSVEAAQAVARTDDNPGPGYARVLRRLALGLRRKLAAVRGPEHHAEAHAARIAGKRVRYLIEALAPSLPAAAALVDEYRAFQDCLGELHDADLAAELLASMGRRAPPPARPGLRALGEALVRRRARAWRAFRREWLTGAERRLVAPALALAGLLGSAGAEVEIERKYLLKGLPPRVREVAPLELEQGYLPGERIRERVRRVRGPSGTRCYRTAKFGLGVTRQEFEDEIPGSLFDGLWPLTVGKRVLKRRYPVPEGELTWEVDEFPALGLVLAEVELPAEAMEPALPRWLRPWVVREVSGEPEYLNSALAR